MQVSLKCPRCGAGLTATKMLPDGTPIQCPHCQHTLRFRVNPPAAAPAPPPKPGEGPPTPRLTPLKSGVAPTGSVIQAELADEPPAAPATVTLSVRALVLGVFAALLLVGLGAGIAVYLLNRHDSPADSNLTDNSLADTDEKPARDEEPASDQTPSSKLPGQGAAIEAPAPLKPSGAGPDQTEIVPGGGAWQAVAPPPEQSPDQVFRAVVNETVLQGVFSPDSKYLTTVEKGGQCYLWNLEQRRRADLLVRDQIDWWEVILQFSPDSRFLAVFVSEGPAMLWSVPDARLLLEWSVGKIYPKGVFFSSDSTRLFECGEHSLSVITLAGGVPQRRTLTDKLNDITLFCGAISPDDRTLVLGGHGQETGEFRFWDLQQNRQSLSRVGFTGSIWDIGFSPDSEHLIALYTQGSQAPHRHPWSGYLQDKELTLWKLNADRTSADLVDRGKGQQLRYLPETGSVLVESIQHHEKIYTQYLFQELEPWNGSHKAAAPINSPSFTFALGGPSSQRVAINYSTSSSGPQYNSAVSVFNVATGLLERPLLETAGVALSPRGRYLLTTSGEIVDLDSRATRQLALAKTLKHPDNITALGGGEQQLVVTTAENSAIQQVPFGGVTLWSMPDFRQLAQVPFKSRADAYALSEDGRVLVAVGRVGQDYATVVFELTAQGVQQRHVIPRNPLLVKEFQIGYASWIQLTPDGKTVVIAWRGGTPIFEIYDLHDAPRRTHLGQPPKDFDTRFATLSPDGKYLALVSSRNEVTLYDTGTQQFQPSLARLSDDVTAIAFSPDSRSFALAGDRGQISLWETRSSARLMQLKGCQSNLKALCFSADGQYVAAAGDNSHGTVGLVWETVSGTLVGNLSGHDSEVTVLQFLPVPQGQRLASGDKNGNLLVWDLPVPSH